MQARKTSETVRTISRTQTLSALQTGGPCRRSCGLDTRRNRDRPGARYREEVAHEIGRRKGAVPFLEWLDELKVALWD